MKLLISGGHLTPALALIDYIKDNHPDVKLVFAGRIYSKKNAGQVSQEQQEVEKRNVPFVAFSSPKLSSNTWYEMIKATPLLIISILKAVFIIVKHKPDVLVSFGGYLAVPLAISSWLLRVKIITHEQTRSAGVANKIIAKFASTIALSYEESSAYFPKVKKVVTGNLIRKKLLDKTSLKPKWLKKAPSQQILYITGGSQGSEIINFVSAKIIKQLVKNWLVIHQCGKPTDKRNYKSELLAIKRKLSGKSRDLYHIREWIDEDELGWIYANAKGVVSRSGANTTEEIALNGIPAVFIPLPFSHNDEQLKNAQALANNDQAVLLEQKNLTPTTLLHSVELINKYNRKYRRNLKFFNKYNNSEEKLFKLIKDLNDKNS
jgi:UDP-N-acetylglucosamine--N-acetylmuramyl-(pentapeptide) pyrophosphoryl-undecaprenol N-acetylglucosamine transferase